ncbi:hypothetical protein [Nostoc foliaceum]|uniref:Uncharacterized protein n=1 Tax=Nostoc linckia FACHB-391 TaxID=2692906 RepID=A0ABR8EUL6_NOSLI|nr:hypothetical protein [Nostoc foliaceum]MBD2560589.1 hypothetical protein [Nostoc linckia FACHB-391]
MKKSVLSAFACDTCVSPVLVLFVCRCRQYLLKCDRLALLLGDAFHLSIGRI